MEVFNARFSIIKFVQDQICTPYSLPLFCSDPKLPAEEAAMSTLDHFLYLEITEGEYAIVQQLDVVFALYQLPEFDPSANWLRRMQRQIEHICVQTKTDFGQNLIALYDYDTLIGASAIQTFLTTGAFPANIQTILATQPPVLRPYLPNGIPSGLCVVPDRRAPVFKIEQNTPYECVWHTTFKFHAATHN